MFGRHGNPFIENPFQYIESYIKKADIIIFNLETVISTTPIPEQYKESKVFNYQSTGEQLEVLKKLSDNKPIFVSIANNHSLDFGVYGLQKTKDFLTDNNFLFANKNESIESNNIVFMNASDHCGCDNIDLWGEHIWIINHNNLDPVIDKVKSHVKKGKIVIFSIHWGSNWISEISSEMKNLGRLLIDNGVKIVFGHSAHHIPPEPLEIYHKGLIIYGLGDFINDYSVDFEYQSDHALMCMVDLDNKIATKTRIIRKFIDQSAIPRRI